MRRRSYAIADRTGLCHAGSVLLHWQADQRCPTGRTRHSQLAQIDDVDVRPSAVCRPDYDCWEVTFTFYDPDNLNRARRGFRYTIDVSDTLPQIIAGSENSFTLR